MNEFRYLINHKNNVNYDGHIMVSNEEVVQAINFCNNALYDLHEQTQRFDINIFAALGLRNLSGVVGEYFASSIARFSQGNLTSNLHQDGYPDLLAVDTEERRAYYHTLYVEKNGKLYPKDKVLFSPYRYGGIEVKATCGSTPRADIHPKPLIGEQRIDLLQSFDWKAHHRETNNLLAIFWDFLNGIPAIVACFYRNDLTIDDWGKIVQPKDDGGRTTSVSIMRASGVTKMCKGWIAVIDDEAYLTAFSRKKWIGKIK